MLQYTSGSTGDAKGVMLTHGNLDHQIRAGCAVMQVTAASTFVHWLPQYHDFGSACQILSTTSSNERETLPRVTGGTMLSPWPQ
jgi:acyl-CoA synthetase (AMP-forming)/AMP-acid ligase II